MRSLFLVIGASLLSCLTVNSQGKKQYIDTNDFRDGAHHWYDIKDRSNTINPLAGRPVFAATEIESIADNILLYQKANGGWPKNYDMQARLSSAQKDSLLRAKNEQHTTFDNGATYAQIAYLAKANTAVPKQTYREAVEKGLDFILAAQYNNGGWPQYFPLENNYSRYITFNDNAYLGIMKLLKDIADNRPQFSFLDGSTKEKMIKAYNNGLACILNMQINDNGKPTAWCQQHNELTLAPAWARKFEPPAICNGESAGIVLFLMSIDNPSSQVKNAIQHAVDWFNTSKIPDTKVITVDAPAMNTGYTLSEHDRQVVNSPGAAPIWTRYYELKTHRPVFCNRDSKLVYSLAEVERERRDGYAWYTYEPQKVLDRFPAWQKKWL
jgi:PelA/Pel-15E family pectate lyase